MPGYTEINREIKENRLQRLYVFHGEEAYLRGHCLERIQKALVPEGAEGFNLHRFSGKGVTLRELAGAAESIPFLCERKLVVVDDFDLMGIPSTERDGWAAFLNNLPDTCCLIFVYDTIPYKPDGRSKIQAALNQSASVVEFKEQGDSALIAWAVRHFKALGKEIEHSLCEHLIFRCGRSMTALYGEIQKVAAYNEAPHIAQEAIDEVTEPVLEAVSFNLSDAVADGNTRKAARILQTLQWMREPPEVLLGAVGKTLRGLYAARLAIEHRKTARDVMEICGYRSAYPAEKLLRSAKKRPLAWCQNALLYCREADAMLKGEIEVERERVMEWLLAKLV
ncbi:MAG: DNA polymerase III subunit delta [Oscillospiraceae bacterium]|jgi:DNA polymerase-3 subunit delta|nr:DNA polymerase III subunit delta [Oscillospiraceae bacterium]